jgi:uncharacterized protein
MSKILITGASGLLGTELSNFLSEKKYAVIHLTRSKRNDKYDSYTWDLSRGYIEKGALRDIDFIIHLAGAGIADKRWSDKRKKEIIDSRVNSAELLFSEIKKQKVKPKAVISASAIGYYGSITSDYIFSETDPAANDFLGTVCSQWEASTHRFNELGIRTVQLRFGVILSAKGGALKKMLIPTKLGFGSALGSGKQFIPWVHFYDVLTLIEKCITNETMLGPYNVVSPSFNTYNEFASTLAKVLNKPFFMPNVPSFLLKLTLGEMSQIVLEGSRISSQKLIDSGYCFQFPNLRYALSDLLKN